MSQEELLKRAFSLTRRHPILWLLALIGGDGFGGGSYQSSTAGGVGGPSSRPDTSALTAALGEWIAWLLANWPLIVLGMVGLFAVTFVISALAAGPLYRGQVELDAGRPFGFGELRDAAGEAIGRVLGLRLLALAILGAPPLLLAAMTLFLFVRGGPPALLIAFGIDLSFLLFYLLLTLIAWPVLTLALRACVLNGLGPRAALFSTFGLIGRRTGKVAISAAITIGLGIAIGTVLGIVETVAALPFAPAVSEALQGLDPRRLLSALVPVLVVEIPLSLLLGSVAGSFYSAYWTLAFINLDEESVPLPPAWRA